MGETTAQEAARLQLKPIVQRAMDLARHFRAAPGTDYDHAYKELETFLYGALASQAPQVAAGEVVAHTAWMIEAKGYGRPLWFNGTLDHEMTDDPNAAIRFPSKEVAEFFFTLLRVERPRRFFKGDISVYAITEHQWIATPPAPAVAEPDLRERLQDPSVVHVAMLRGEIAKPDLRAMLHIYGSDVLDKWDAAQPAGEREPDDVLEALDLDPEKFRTEGGAINKGKLRAAILHPYNYLPEDHWMQARFSKPGGRPSPSAPLPPPRTLASGCFDGKSRTVLRGWFEDDLKEWLASQPAGEREPLTDERILEIWRTTRHKARLAGDDEIVAFARSLLSPTDITPKEGS